MRYSGSKRRFIKYLKSILEQHLDNDTWFIDAFCGGCNVLSEIDHDKKVGIELNSFVYSLWVKLKHGGMDGLPKSLTREEYNDIKQSYLNNDGKYPMWLIGYVGSALSWGGAWFNGYSAYNPNKNEDHMLEAYNGLKKQLDNFKQLDKTLFTNSSYDEFNYWDKCVIYCDPPYASTKKYESDFDNEAFWEWVRNMSRMGHYVYVSEYEAPDDFKCVWSMEKKDGMGTTKTGKKQNTKIEKLFVYDGR